MLNFNKGNAADYAVVTLTEKATLGNGFYLFLFTSSVTKDVISHIVPFSNDLSLYKNRYNKFLINSASLFADAAEGNYIYNIYEQLSDTNTDPSQAKLLETGKMNLSKAVGFSVTKYDTQTNFKVYAG